MSGTGARVLTAVVLIPLVVWLVLWGPTWLVGCIVALLALIALQEFFSLSSKMDMPGFPRFTLVCAVWGVLGNGMREVISWNHPIPHVVGIIVQLLDEPSMSLVFFVLGIAGLTVFSRRAISSALANCAVSAAGLIFVALPLNCLVSLHAHWRVLLLFTLILVWAGDTAAFFVGRKIGRHPLAPLISPKKTVEGAVGNVLGSVLAGYVFYLWQQHFRLGYCLIAAIVVSIAGQIGDLFESAWKRAAGVKDSGTLLPGHGGILDRIDALLVAAPVAMWYFSFFYAGQ